MVEKAGPVKTTPEKMKEWMERHALWTLVESILFQSGATWEEVVGKEFRRFKHVTRARRRVWKMVRDQLGWSYPAIGQLFGWDHTSVLDGIKIAEEEDDHVRP